jgi:hypothetical protein
MTAEAEPDELLTVCVDEKPEEALVCDTSYSLGGVTVIFPKRLIPLRVKA